MSDLKWSAPESIVTSIDTGLNSLAANALVAGAVIDNSHATTGLRLYVSFELTLASVDFSAASYATYLWLLCSIDGTNYEDGSASVTPARSPDVIFALRNVNGAQLVKVEGILLHPYKYTPLLKNVAAAGFAAANNTLKYRRHYLQSV